MIILSAVFAGLSALASLISMIPTLSINPFVVMESAINIPRAFWQHIAKLEVNQPPQAYVAEDIAPTFTNSVATFDPEAFQLDLFRPAGPPSIVMNVTKELAIYQPAAILAPEPEKTDDKTETDETICPVTFFSDLVFDTAIVVKALRHVAHITKAGRFWNTPAIPGGGRRLPSRKYSGTAE